MNDKLTPTSSQELKIGEVVDFRLIQTPCCGHLLCWVNPRFPSYCPQCGKMIYPDVKNHVLKRADCLLKEVTQE